MREQELMKRIQAAVSLTGAKCFRTNVGTGWVGSRVRRNPDGSITIYDPRVFSTGLPRGFPDLTAFCPGGRTAFLEVKTATGRLSEDQKQFAGILRPMGFAVETVRGEDEAVRACSFPKDF